MITFQGRQHDTGRQTSKQSKNYYMNCMIWDVTMKFITVISNKNKYICQMVILTYFLLCLSSTGIHIISVGIGNWLDLYELEMMASYPSSQNMIRVQNFDSLNSIVDTIRDAACDSKLILMTLDCHFMTCK